jgi:hypothetical protein
MGNIKFVSHEEFSEDQYTKELVYLLIDDKYRVAYIRKQAKNGGQFWAPATLGVTKNGSKVYYECFMQDSAFLEKDIRKYLEDRSWEKKEETMDEKARREGALFAQMELPF